ncbi:MAG: PHP domain-containing protein [Atopobiaceae bacterium]|jgi:putative hydrolase|nr:PHP domain-containing protein [Atopobiaceae bacterium]MCH4180818.1 PHP domain-containing protein [Atopobiaceae bacterium]MCH4214139.1 PHP domain-containing protein [Atopobiaceae bacterium]MCH4229687.1 PHP domain-containing protein [Atopobiaceae bacterium]MCH4276491.1 PHP domain-containing protein [Atopobiaceae bacterium]
MLQNRCDVHTHTLYSRHAYSTIEENVRAAADADLELLGDTEHFSSMLYGTGFDIRDYQYFVNMAVWPRVWHGVRLLHGVEADIVDLEGHLYGWDIPVPESIVGSRYATERTLYEHVVPDQDYAIASIHYAGFCEGATVAQTTRMYLAALADSNVLVLGHTGRSGVDFDVPTVVGAARDAGKLIEINEHSLDAQADHSLAPCTRIAECCAELGCMVAVNTDAHISASVGKVPAALAMLEGIGFPQELVATRDAATFEAVRTAALG